MRRCHPRRAAGATVPFGPVRFEDGPAMLPARLRRRHAFEDAERTVAEQWRRFLSDAVLPGRVGASRYGILCGADAAGFEYMCAVEVASFDRLAAGVGRMRVPGQRFAVFVHPDGAPSLRSTWRAIFDWLSDGEFESAHAPDFEVYLDGVDPLAPGAGVEVRVGVVRRTER